MNKCILIGHIGSIEIKNKKQQNKMAILNIATNENFKDGNGNSQQRTYWHKVIAWNGLTNILEKYAKKGTRIEVEGKLIVDNWETDEGIRVRDVKVMAQHIELL